MDDSLDVAGSTRVVDSYNKDELPRWPNGGIRREEASSS